MIINELVIYGFGKWVDKTFPINENLQIFIGENESGKSTIAAFIQQILFGFPRSNAKEKSYEPKFASEYGGKLLISDERYGDLSIERTLKTKMRGDVVVTFENGETADESFLEILLNGVSQTFYQSIFGFDLEGLQQVDKLSKNDANRFFIDAGLLGGDRFIKRYDEVDAKAQTLYTPRATKRPLNVAIAELDDLTRQLERAKEKNSQYLQLLATKQDLKTEENKKQEERLRLQNEGREIDRLSDQYEEYERYKKLHHFFQENPLTRLPKEGLNDMKRYREQLENLDKKLIEQEQRLDQLKTQFVPSKLLEAYQNNDEIFEDIQKQLPYIEEALAQNTVLIEEQNDLINRLEKLAENLGVDIDNPPVLDETAETEWQRIEEAWGKKASEKKSILEDHQKVQAELEEQEVQSSTNQADNNSSQKGLYIAGIIIGILLLLFSTNSLQLVGAVVAAISAVLFFMSFRQNNDDTSVFDTQIDELKTREQTLKTEREKIDKELNQLNNQWQDFKQQYHLSSAFDHMSSHRAIVNLDQLNYYKGQLDSINQRLDNFYSRVDTFDEELAVLRPFMTTKRHNLEQYIQEVRQLIDTLVKQKEAQKSYLENAKNVEQQKVNIKEDKRNTQEKMEKLFHNIDAENLDDYFKQYNDYEKYSEWYDEYNALKEKLKNDLNTYHIYGSQNKLGERKRTISKTIQEINRDIQESRDLAVGNAADIQLLEDGGNYSTLLQEVENKKSELKDLVDEWVVLKLQSDLIKRTLENAQEGLLPEAIEEANKCFKRLTSERYTEILFVNNYLKVKRADGEIFDASELSTATAEQLYVAMRFAFILSVNETMQLPIIIDDGFVNFDHFRTEVMWDIIAYMSQFTQVICFTHNEGLESEFSESEILLL